MRVNPLFETFNSRPQKRPVYFVHFGPIGSHGDQKVLTIPTGTGYGRTGSNSAFDVTASKFTVRGWIYPTANNVNNGLVSRTSLPSGPGGDQGDWAFGFFNGSSMKLTFRFFGAALQGNTVLALDQWHFVEANFDGSSSRIYLNGVLEASGGAPVSITNNPKSLVFGAYFNTTHAFVGKMSDWEFCSNFTRSNANYVPPQKISTDSNMTVYYRMNEGRGGVLFDSSGHSFTSHLAGNYSLGSDIRRMDSGLGDLPTEFASGPVKNAAKARPVLMGIPTGVSQQISPLAGKSTIGGANFKLLDKDEAVTRMVTNYPMKNRLVTIFGGFEEMEEQYFRVVFTGKINNWQLTPDFTMYEFILTDFQRESRTSVFDGATKLAAKLTTTDNVALVYSVRGFAPKTDMGDGRGPVNFIRIDDEIFSYTGLKQPGAGEPHGTILGLQREEFFTIAVDHDANSDVTNFVKLRGNPIDIALQILTSTGTGTNGPYDVLQENQGCGIDQSFIDIKGFEDQRDRLLKRDQFLFYMQESVDAQTFLSDEIYKFENSYPIVLDDGRIGLKVYSVNLTAFNLPVLDDKNTLPNATFVANLESQQGFYNEIITQLDHDPMVDDFFFTLFNEEPLSQHRSAEAAAITFESKGIKAYGKFDGTAIINRFASNVFKRYAKGAPQISVSCFFSQHLLNAGDQVVLDLSILPNLEKGKRGGWNAVCEIISKDLDYESGIVGYTLLATGYVLNKKYGAITPISIYAGGTFPVYSGATAQQKQYAFVGKQTGPSAVFQQNGDPGIYVTP